MKILILHDYFDKYGGGEKLVINLAKELHADIYTGFIEAEKTFPTQGIRIQSLGVNPKLPQAIRNIIIARKFRQLKIKYDLYIFSGVWCISAAENLHPNLLYCHTPPRFIYDLNTHFMKKLNPMRRRALKMLIDYWKPRDQEYMRNFDVIVTNSENVRRRLQKYYGNKIYRKARIVYTGFETEKFYWKNNEEFYLSSSRLDELKRINIIIRAFKKLNKKLIITGTGPDEKRLKKIAQGAKNIIFTGAVSDKKLVDLYARCKATIVAAKDEDLGLSALESQAAGKPVIAVNEGGFKETITGKTGVFFEPNVKSIVNAIKKSEKIRWDHEFIQKNTRKYDIKVFSKKIQTIINHNFNQ